MKVGFTGTRHGMTKAQREAFLALIRQLNPRQFHHGDCVGADDQAATDVAEMDNAVFIVCHPPIDNVLRAFNSYHVECRTPNSHFARNRCIVNETDVLVACPPYMDDITKDTRGGTAYTVCYARRLGRPVYVVRPDGSLLAPAGSPGGAGEGAGT